MMTVDSNSRKLLYKLAVSYYEDGLTQKQIGKRFGISRIKVSRLLRQARDQKLVQIVVTPIDDVHSSLERAIESRYGIDEVVTVTPADHSRPDIGRALGPLVAESLMRSIQGKEVIAITWGSTLNAVVDSLPVANWPDLRIIQALGGLSSPDAEINGSDLVRRMAQSFGARPLLLSSPGFVTNRAVRDALLLDTHISKMLSIAAKADIAVVGIGVLTPDSVVRQNNILNDAEIDRLKAKGVAGDIGMRFFDRQGESIDDEINDRAIGLDLEQYKKIRRVIGVAGGVEKVEAIRAALRGHLIDVLITDEQTGIRLLEDNWPEPKNHLPEDFGKVVDLSTL